MHQAIQTFHIGLEDGTETLVRAGKVFPDNHPFVKADIKGVLFEHIDEFGPSPKKEAK